MFTHSKRRAPPIFKDAAGSTLVELLVGISIMTMLTGAFSTSLFQASFIQRSWRDDVIATKEWRHAGSLFASDALNAQSTSLADGAAPVDSVTLDWTSDGVSHTATYNLSGTKLRREFDGLSMDVARDVQAARFSRSGATVAFDLEVKAERGGTESMSLQTYLRMLQ